MEMMLSMTLCMVVETGVRFCVQTSVGRPDVVIFKNSHPVMLEVKCISV